MNIFYLDSNPVKAAQQMCDKHVIKQTLESAQMLCTILNEKGYHTPYKSTHKHHPCTVWASMNEDNYTWLYEHFKALCFEYTRRYNKTHKCESMLFELQGLGDWTKHTSPALAMPDHYKTDCPIESYKAYYVGDKAYMARWSKLGNVPDWFYISLQKAAC